ncbi:Atp-binding protein, partial [Globisporangium splendens]
MATPQTTTRARITSEETRCAHAAVFGDEALRGKLLGSGPILHQVDLLVAEVCNVIAQKPVVTVAFDTFRLLRPVYHGDFIRLEGRGISVNSSSMVCQVSVYRQDFATGEFQLTHNVVATFVAMGKDGKVSRGLPTLYDPLRPAECAQLQELAAKRKELTARWQQAQTAVTQMGTITHAMIPRHKYAAGRKAIDIQTTVVETRHTFIMKHANVHGNVFGGVLLEWMDHLALYCARQFTKNYNMVTVGMDRVHFKLPINLHHMVSIRARICRVRYFEVLNLEDDNRKREIHLDVTADENDQDAMQSLLKAQRRGQFEKHDAELLALPAIPTSAPKTFVPSLTARI